MFPAVQVQIELKALQLVEGISNNLQSASKSVDMLDWMGRAALEIIGQAGMGHSFDPLTSESSSDPYTKAAKTYLCVYLASALPPYGLELIYVQALVIHPRDGGNETSEPYIDQPWACVVSSFNRGPASYPSSATAEARRGCIA